LQASFGFNAEIKRNVLNAKWSVSPMCFIRLK
jgi:hypothetical protein